MGIDIWNFIKAARNFYLYVIAYFVVLVAVGQDDKPSVPDAHNVPVAAVSQKIN